MRVFRRRTRKSDRSGFCSGVQLSVSSPTPRLAGFSFWCAAKIFGIQTFASSMSVFPGRPFCLQVYSYVYVVAVNKCRPFLWISLVYRAESVRCRTHNQLHRMCGWGQEPGVTFCVFGARRSYPVYVHTPSTSVAPAFRRVMHSLRWITFHLVSSLAGCSLAQSA